MVAEVVLEAVGEDEKVGVVCVFKVVDGVAVVFCVEAEVVDVPVPPVRVVPVIGIGAVMVVSVDGPGAVVDGCPPAEPVVLGDVPLMVKVGDLLPESPNTVFRK